MVLSSVAGPSKIELAQAADSSPKVGDEIYGFDLKKTDYDSATKSTEYLFVHKNTGAKLLVMKNNDKNRGFSIKFNTPAENDKGINHIIEHSVLGGSEKYHSNNILYDLNNTTYTSYANAFTYQNMTVFPICSESEQQLLKSADIYLDAVYHPLLLSDERIFEREGLRYELSDTSADLTCNGIVYNEMQGSLGNIETAAFCNAKKAIFPNGTQGNISGGDPKAITKLSYEEVVETYKKYYHPSNSFMVLYGDVDYQAFLKMIDENYLSSYNKKSYEMKRDSQKANRKIIQKTYDFPVAASENTDKKSVIDLVFAVSDLKKLGLENYTVLDNVVSLLDGGTTELKDDMIGSNIAATYKIFINTDSFQPTIHFMAINADPSKKMKFYKLIMDELKMVVKTGIPTQIVKTSLRPLEFQKALGNNKYSAVNAMLNASSYDNGIGNSLIHYEDYQKKLIKNLDQGVLEKVIKKQILDNSSVALTVTIPKKGLLEKNKKALASELTKKKSSMTKEQLESLVQDTKDFNTWNSQKTSNDVLKSLRAVSLKDLPTEIRDRNVKETTIDGAKLWTADADVDSIGESDILFDLSHLTSEELLYLKFYSDMINNLMSTDNRSEGQVANDMRCKANSLSCSVSELSDDKNDTTAHPVFGIYYYGFADEYKDTFDLVSDILLHSRVTDHYVKRTIANTKAQYQSSFADPLNLAWTRSSAYTSPYYQYENYLNGLDYYNFVLSLEKLTVSDPSKLISNIKAVRSKAFNKNNLTILFAGDTGSQEKYKAAMPKFTKEFPDVSYKKEVYSLPKPAKREAWTINSNVAYVCVNGSLSENKVPISSKFNVINGILNNLMLVPEIRLKGGAYGVSAATGDNSYSVYTYRDSNFVNSLTTIGGTDEFLKAISPNVTEDMLESYKLSAYASATQINREVNDAISTLFYELQGVTIQDRNDRLKEIQDMSLTDLSSYVDYLSKINSNLNYVIVASPSNIEANKDLFDTVIALQ